MAVGSPVDLVKSKTDLVHLVSGYVSGLKKSGRNWWACCPFHSEKTPSFCIWPEDDRWKCFGCGAGGDVFAFVMRIENLDFPASLKLLAEKAGVQLDDRPVRREDSGRKQRLLELNAAASLWFHNMLLNHELGAHARQFVERRHLTRQTVIDFQLGYAPDSWEMLRQHLLERGYSVEEQMAAGVLHESEKALPYDRFRNRLIYPIRDAGGHVIAFGGRDLGEDKKGAKFINSPQTELFDKSATLYALDRAKNSMRSLDQAIVVEGYMDAIMAHQHGITNVVCSMGTSLTDRQVEQIKKLTTHLVLALDPDTAGDIATDRGVDVASQVFDRELVPVPSARGLINLEAKLKGDIRIMVLPRGKDPDEVIHEDVAEWQRLVQEALAWLEYKFQQILARHDLANPKEKTAVVAELAGELRQVPDRIERTHYLQRLATILSVPEAELALAMSQASVTSRRSRPESTQPDESPESEGALPRGLDAEDYLLMRALRYLDAADLWRNNLETEEVSKSANREVLQYLLARLEDGSTPSFETLPDDLPEGLAQHVQFLLRLASREPEIARADLSREFEWLILKLRERNAIRSQAERAMLLSASDSPRIPHLETGALEDLARMHHSKKELGRRTLLARP